MTTAANMSTPNRQNSILNALLDLFRFGWGSAKFTADDTGKLIHTCTDVTVKMNKGETVEAFITRLQTEYDWRKGDQLEILANGGKYDAARITRMPR